MKKKFKLHFAFILSLVVLVSCNDDFLERVPQDSISDATFFKTVDDLKAYTAGFYRQLPRYQKTTNMGGNNGSDVFVTESPSGSLMKRGESGQAPQDDKTWNGHWDWLRSINYYISNAYKVTVDNAEANHYIGEGYFWRARRYFSMLKTYGAVPIMKEAVGETSEKLYLPRSSRYDVAMFIINDLDSAIAKMSWKGAGPAKDAGRVNKESAISLKAEVALFEGTWERYHAAKSSKFAVEGKNGNDFLQLIEPTVKELIEHQGDKIFKSTDSEYGEAYNQLFSQMDCSNTPGVFMYRVYDNSMFEGHNFYNDPTGEGGNITKRLVDLYLASDGKPQEITSVTVDNSKLNDLYENLEPRFKQTLWTPNRGRLNDIKGYDQTRLSKYPGGNTKIVKWKGAIFDRSQYRNGSTDHILIRYAEPLLAMAEAKAILGTITQDDIDKTVNLLRSRVGTPAMVLSDVEFWNVNYSAKEGFNPTEANIVNEIRRERTIELALEFKRKTDIKRWAVMDDVYNGYLPRGAHGQEFIDYFNSPDSLLADGIPASDHSKHELREGENFYRFSDGFINPFGKVTEFQDGGDGYFIDPDRDYLKAIPKRQIDLYREDANVELTQNPGWF